MAMANIIVMPSISTSSKIIPNITIYPPITQTSMLTPFCALAPNYLATLTKIQIQITLETIYEEEDEKEASFETPTTSSPSPTNLIPNPNKDLFIPNSQASAFLWSKITV
ncbi:hypothetical protein VNO78_03122 [Psophocarpus tetragonolobus]|uniref:Uncharacterized protein n=1 Tax=Psophocarpus tetragonolobus TaxID=3891 RepID=A0AAN9TCK7_PSOTE